jgi:hypothetical protein
VTKRKASTGGSPTVLEKARDELFSHILRCEVLGAQDEHQREWFDDTMEYMAERYPGLSDEQLAELRQLGERYVQPVIKKPEVSARS